MLLIPVILLALCVAAKAWEKIVIPVPMLSGNKLSIDIDSVRKSLESLQQSKCIWVMGKFKVGKSFIIDYIRNDGEVTANALENTIGLNVWVGDRIALFDTEGLMQPVGDNNVYFLKEFLINFMRRTADNFVFVTDQVDVTDLAFYDLFKQIYWNSKMFEMYHIHNCKSLTEASLQQYQERITELKKLSSNNLDEEFEDKVIQHLFLPKLSDSGVHKFLESLFGQSYKIDFIGNRNLRRKKLSLVSYMDAVDDSLLVLGSHPLEKYIELTSDINKVRQSFLPIASELFPNKVKWCRVKNSNDEVMLYIETTKLISVSPEASDIAVRIETLNGDFQVTESTLRFPSPVPIIQNSIHGWTCSSTDKGYSVIRFKYVYDSNAAKLRECKSEELTFQPCSNLYNQVTRGTDVNWDYVLATLNTADQVTRQLKFVYSLFN